MTYVHRCLIVPADLAPLARTLTESVAGPAGAGMFQTALSPDGNEPATHYISSGMIEDTFADVLASPEALFAVAGEYVTLEQCEDILGRCDVSGEPGQVAMGRLGLQMVQVGDDAT